LFLDEFLVPLGNEGHEAAPDQLLALSAEIAAVGLVNEGERPVRQKTTDQFSLILDDGAIASLGMVSPVVIS